MIFIEGHYGVWDVGWFEEGIGYCEPNGSEEAGHQNEAVECCDYVCFGSAVFLTPFPPVTYSVMMVVENQNQYM
jgi:hypothetical protein